MNSDKDEDGAIVLVDAVPSSKISRYSA